ncbi:MAG: hypothetical protein HDR10_01165 [Lachnospiraceae bacterium]|nr:hypothetical protein [Lachnospiraceae bacterium]
MLTRLKESDFEKYAEFAYSLALDLTSSGYPTYADGIKTKKEFIDRSRIAFARENEEILLYERDGQVRGWIHYYYLPAERYLDTCSFCISEGMGEAISEFVTFAREHFPGSELYMGFPKENTEAVAALEIGGYPCIEESYNNVMFLAKYEPVPDCPDIVPITRENYEPFGKLHSRHMDMYWNSERLLEDIDNWTIYLYWRDGVAAGAIYFTGDSTLSEIFGIDFSGDYDAEVYRVLVTKALNEAKRNDVRYMVFFNEDEEQADALKLGFHCVSKYVCYCIEL